LPLGARSKITNSTLTSSRPPAEYIDPTVMGARQARGLIGSSGVGLAYDLYLTRAIKNATLVRYATASLAVSQFISDKLEVVAGVKKLLRFATTHADVRVMDGRFHVIEEAIGTPRGRNISMPYLRTFIEEMKANGFIAQARSTTSRTRPWHRQGTDRCRQVDGQVGW
jgi:hypothetical protein